MQPKIRPLGANKSSSCAVVNGSASGAGPIAQRTVCSRRVVMPPPMRILPHPGRTFPSLVIDNFTRALVGPAVVGHAVERLSPRRAETARTEEFGVAIDRDL
jgi:hypothetical protein